MQNSNETETKKPVSNNTMQSLEKPTQSGDGSVQNTPVKPLKPKRKKSVFIIIAIAILLVGSLAWLALGKAKTNKKKSDNSTSAGEYKTVPNPVLGDSIAIPNQSFADQVVSINGKLNINGGLNLSKQAVSDLSSAFGGAKVNLQASTGVAQVGNINLSGAIIGSNFQGNGTNLSNLNAAALTTGTLSNDRLDTTVTRLGQTIPLSALQSTVLTSINGISSGDDINIVGDGNVTVSTDTLTKQITISAASVPGDITSVIAGTGLTGGGTSGDVTLDIDTGTVTVQGNSFNGANQLVQLDSSGNLPVLDGSALTNLNASNLASGTVNDSRLSTNVTVQGNSFNGNSQLVKLNGASELPTVSGINLTNLNANSLVTGSISDSRLSGNVTLQGNTFNLASKLVQLDNTGKLTALNGSALINLNASNIASGSINDSRLSANVALLDANQTFAGNVDFSGTLTANTIQPSASMVIGAVNQSLTLQGDMTTKLAANDSGNTVSLGFSGTPTGNVIYTLDAATTPGTYTLCTTVGNCAGSGDGVTSLGGTTNKLAKFTGSQAVGDSSISDTGSLVTVAANGLFKAGSDSTTAFRVQNAAGSTNVFTVDSTNTRVAIGQATASYPLDVSGDINSTTALRVGGNLVCDSTGCLAGSGSGFYIQNSSSLQTAANINIESAATGTPTLVVQAKSGQTANLFEAKSSLGSVIASVDASGNINTTGLLKVNGSQIASSNLSDNSNIAKLNGSQTYTGQLTFQKSSNSTTALQIQNSTGTSNLFVADTTNTRIGIGTATPGYTLDVNGDLNITLGSSYRINGVAICGPTATCAPSSGSDSYIQNSVSAQTNANLNIQTASSSSIVAIFKGAASQSADLLQARDSDDNVLAKITSTGAIYQGSNQVCDASNNCGFAVASGSSNYIQNGTSQQTGNYNIKSAAAGSVTAVLQGATSQSADLLQVKSGGGVTVANIDKDGNVTATSFSGSGSGLTSLNATNISSGSLSDSRLSANVTIQGNTFNGASQLLQLDGSGNLPVVSGAAVTSLNATNIASGSLSDSRLSANVTTAGNSFNGNSQLVQTTAGGALPVLSGTNLTSLNATNIASGSLNDSRLSANVALLNGTNTFVGATTFQNTANSTSALTIANSSAVALFVADTTNKYIIIGSSVANANPVLLVLNNYNSSADPTGTDGAMYYNTVLKTFRCRENGFWANCISGLANHTTLGWNTFGNSTFAGSFTGFGTAITTIGSGTSYSNPSISTSNFSQVATAATTNSISGISSSNAEIKRSYNPVCTIRVYSTSASQTNMRVYAGLTSQPITNSDDPSTNAYVLFRYSTVAGDTGWRAITKVGAAGAQNVESGNVSGVTIADSTEYVLRIRYDPVTTLAYLSVNGGSEMTVSTNLPPLTTRLNMQVGVTTNENVSKNWNFGRFYCEES